MNGASPRAQPDGCRARFDGIKRRGEAGAETPALTDALFLLPGLLMAALLEKATPKTPRSSGLPPSQAGKDVTARGDGKGSRGEGSSGKGPKAEETDSGSLRTVTLTETSPVTECRKCVRDLSGTARSEHGERVGADIVFETAGRRVEAEARDCPRCRARTVPPRRTAAMIQAMAGRLLSEATLPGFVPHLHQALEDREEAAIARLPAMPVLNVDETSLRADGKNR